MDEFVHRPKHFKSLTPKIDQVMPPAPREQTVAPKNELPIAELSAKPASINAKSALAGSGINKPTDDLEPKLEIDLDKDAPAPLEPSSNRFKLKKPKLTKKMLLIFLGVLVVVIVGAGAAYWFFVRDINKQASSDDGSASIVEPTPTPTPISPLTGVELASAALAARPVTGLMIENSYAARPQSGLIDAGIVFEAIAEGGITRFLALYQEAQPQYIGPIRSIRPYYIDFAMAFDAAVGHAGGSPDALSDIANLGMKNLEVFAHGDVFWRISEREAPHNVYTSFAAIDGLSAALGYTASNFTPFEHKPDVPQTPTAAVIDFSISGPAYSPHFEYDATTNTYKRFQDGEAHIDATTSAQISPKVVIAMIMGRSLMGDGSHNSYNDVGSGTMYVFQDGVVSVGTWAKASRTSSFVLTDKNGLPMQLNAGQAWISVVEADSLVTYRP
jgi:hypothetical protein